MSDQSHWDGVYGAKRATEVSWYQQEPSVSLKHIMAAKLGADAPIIDIGGGASTLVDHLLDLGHHDLTVLDIAESALAQAKARVGARAHTVAWISADVTTWSPPRQYLVWHDRAVLHFLTSAEDQQAYATTLRAALAPGGCAIIAGFAPGGPTKCSGLPIVQHNVASLKTLLGHEFESVAVEEERHHTPWGAEQKFRYHVFKRSASR